MKKVLLKNILSLITFIIMILLCIVVISLNVLPTKYFITFIIAEILLLGLSIFLYNLKNKVFMILGILFMLLSIGGNSFLYYYLSKTNQYINNNFAIKAHIVKTAYYVVTGSSNEINGIEELDKDTPIEYYQYSRAVEKAIKKLGEHNFIATDNGFETIEKVKNTNSYLVMSKGDFNFIIEASNVLSEDQFKIINEFDVSEEEKINQETPSAYNIYINGVDYSGERRDYNLIATINTKTHKIVLTSIPRDYYIYIPAYQQRDSLSALGTVDAEITKEALEELFRTKIDYVLNVQTESLVKVVDTIGGVEFCANKSFYTSHDLTLGSYDDYGEKLYVKKGCNTYNGLEALAIARERVHLSNGERERIDNCRQLLINIGKKLIQTVDLSNYEELLASFDGLYTSTINKKTITNLIKETINNPNYEIIEQKVDGEDGTNTGRFGRWNVWTLEPNPDTVDAAAGKIYEILNEK